MITGDSPTHERATLAAEGLLAKFLGILALIMLIGAVLVPAPASAQNASDEARFITLVNEVRADNGLPPLVQNNELTQLSRGWAVAQRDGVCGEGNFICHANPISEGVTQDWRKLGENVGTGPSLDPVMDAFIASPSHFRNIVDPDFTHIGVGVVWDGGRLYTTHRFMTLSAPAPAPTPTAAPTTTAAPATTRAPAPTVAPTTTAAPATTTAPAPAPAPTVAPTTTTAPVAAPTTPVAQAPTATPSLATPDSTPAESATLPNQPAPEQAEATEPAADQDEIPAALPFTFTADDLSDSAEDSTNQPVSAADTSDQMGDRVIFLLNTLNALESAR